MTDDDRWRSQEPPSGGPSTPPDLTFNPLATGIGVFVAVTIPILVVGFALAGGKLVIAVVAVVLGLAAGIIAGIWVAGRDGKVWRGPQL